MKQDVYSLKLQIV